MKRKKKGGGRGEASSAGIALHDPGEALAIARRHGPPNFWSELDAAVRRDAAERGIPPSGWAWQDAANDAVARLTFEKLSKAVQRGDIRSLHEAASLTTLAAWRTTRGEYRFDPDLLAALEETEIQKLPVSLLQRLPEDAVYIALPGRTLFSQRVRGAWLQLSWLHPSLDAGALAPGLLLPGEEAPEMVGEFRIITWTEEDRLASHVMPLLGPDLRSCLNSMFRVNTAERDRLGQLTGQRVQTFHSPAQIERSKADIMLCLNLALYLCSEEHDLEGIPRTPPGLRGKAQPAPATTHVLQAGRRFGAALRLGRKVEAEQADRRTPSGQEGKVRAIHVRRAHWHTYRTGAGRAIPVLRWLHPMVIGARELEGAELPTTVRAVDAATRQSQDQQ